MRVVEERRPLSQSTEQGLWQLLLNSLAPSGVRSESSFKLGLTGAWSAQVQVPGWSVVLMVSFAQSGILSSL